MILVKKIEVEEVDENKIELSVYDPPCFGPKVLIEENIKVHREIIHGKRFIKPDGKEICLGLSKQVHDTIGIYFEAFESEERQNLRLHLEVTKSITAINKLTSKLNEFRSMGFWKRLKFLFDGDKNN